MSIILNNNNNQIIGKQKAKIGVKLFNPSSADNLGIFSVINTDKLHIVSPSYTSVFSIGTNEPDSPITTTRCYANGILIVASNPPAENNCNIRTYVASNNALTYQSLNATLPTRCRGFDLHPDQNWLITGTGFNQGLYVYQLTSSAPITWTFSSATTGYSSVNDCRFNSDGTLIAFVGITGGVNVLEIYAFNSITGARTYVTTAVLPANSFPRAVEWITDSYIAVLYNSAVGFFSVFNFNGSTLTNTFTSTKNQNTQYSKSIAINAARDIIVTGSEQVGAPYTKLCMYSFNAGTTTDITANIDTQPASGVLGMQFNGNSVFVATVSDGFYQYDLVANNLVLNTTFSLSSSARDFTPIV